MSYSVRRFDLNLQQSTFAAVGDYATTYDINAGSILLAVNFTLARIALVNYYSHVLETLLGYLLQHSNRN
ncbi:hypothetical protein D3C80_1319980 [compost metagenome]